MGPGARVPVRLMRPPGVPASLPPVPPRLPGGVKKTGKTLAKQALSLYNQR